MLEINEIEYIPLAEKAVKSFARNCFASYFSEEDLNDISQDVSAKMWEKRYQYDESRGTVTSWVGMIAHNAVLDAYKREQRRRSRFSSAPLEERIDENGDVCNFVPAASDETDAWLIANDTERHFRNSVTTERNGRLLDELINDYSRDEMAEMENVSTSAIYTAVHHLRRRLNSAA